MKKVILAVLIVVLVSYNLSAQTAEQNKSLKEKIYEQIDVNRENLMYDFLVVLFEYHDFQNFIAPGPRREEIRQLLLYYRDKRSQEVNFSEQDSLIAYAVGIDLSDRDAIERIQATRQVINQLAEEKAKIEVDKMLGATWKVALNNLRRSEEGYDVLERAPWDFVIDLFNNAISQRDSVNKE